MRSGQARYEKYRRRTKKTFTFIEFVNANDQVCNLSRPYIFIYKYVFRFCLCKCTTASTDLKVERIHVRMFWQKSGDSEKAPDLWVKIGSFFFLPIFLEKKFVMYKVMYDKRCNFTSTATKTKFRSCICTRQALALVDYNCLQFCLRPML